MNPTTTLILLLTTALLCAMAQVPEIPNLSRGDLTVNIVVKYPEDTLEEYGYFNSPFYLYGNGLCLSWDEGTVMEHTLEDTWELTVTFVQTPAGYACNNTLLPGLLGINSLFEYRVVINDTVEMLGANCASNLPISMTAPYYEESPKIYCNPWFFTREGSYHVERIQGEPDLIKSRNMHFYLPPSFNETYYKQYPIIFAPDLGVGISDIIFGNPDRMKISGNLNDELIVTQGTMDEIIMIGTADYIPDPRNPLIVSDRWDFLGPVRPNYYPMCTNGTFFSGCNGCFNISEVETVNDILYVLIVLGCGSLQPVGGRADVFIDFLLNEVMDFTLQLTDGRVLTDQKHMGLMGCSLGGIFSCYAAWTRPDVFGSAGCQSASFWWPQNERGNLQFDMENIYIHEQRENRPFQNMFMDFGDLETDNRYRMGEAPLSLCNSMAELEVFEWNNNLYIDAYMGKIHGNYECMERAWVFLTRFYQPLGGPRNPISQAPVMFKMAQVAKAAFPFAEKVEDVEKLDDIDVQEALNILEEYFES